MAKIMIVFIANVKLQCDIFQKQQQKQEIKVYKGVFYIIIINDDWFEPILQGAYEQHLLETEEILDIIRKWYLHTQQGAKTLKT